MMIARHALAATRKKLVLPFGYTCPKVFRAALDTGSFRVFSALPENSQQQPSFEEILEESSREAKQQYHASCDELADYELRKRNLEFQIVTMSRTIETARYDVKGFDGWTDAQLKIEKSMRTSYWMV